MRAGVTAVLALLTLTTQAAGQRRAPACASDNAGITVPAGFCVVIAADTVGRPRHVAVAPNGDVYIALDNRPQNRRGGVLGLRDTDGDGVFDRQERFGENGGSGITVRGNMLYFATNDAVLRYRLNGRDLRPEGAPDTIVRELPTGGHGAKSLALGRGNQLFVNIGSRSNSCQVADRQNRSPGHDPCTELETRAGIWGFDANKLNQRQSDGTRYATGLRNAFAITTDNGGQLYAVQHGRDQLSANWGFSNEYNAENPAEILARPQQGDDYGWPYCYYSNELKKTVLAPEYGGDGTQVGRCAQKKAPLAVYPGHWAPNGITIYQARQFPTKYRNGAFIAFHGSWNRAPLPQAGFNVVFQPLRNGAVAGPYEVFAQGFNAGQPARRPTGVAVARDGSLIVTDDAAGRIYRVVYRGR